MKTPPQHASTDPCPNEPSGSAPRRALLAAVLSLAGTGAVQGETTTGALPGIVVSATRTPQAGHDVAAAIDTVDASDIRAMGPQVNLSESLQRVPGVSVLNRQNYAQDLQVSVRGFGARSTFGVRGVRLYADGIPGTMPDGVGQSALFDLGSAERIEVLRGPASVLYGNAAGGVLQVFTEDGPPRPEATALLSVGSDGFHREQLKLGGDTGDFNYVVSASHFETDGWRDHSAARRDHLNAKLRWRLQDRATVTVVAGYLNMPGVQDPLGLPEGQWRETPRSAVPAALTYDTRKDIENGQVGVVYELAVGADDTLRLMAYDGHRSVRQFQAIPASSQTARHPGGVIDFSRHYSGLDGRYTWRTLTAHGPLTVTGGFNLDNMDEDRQGYQNFIGGQLGVLGALRRNEDNTVRNNDQYVLAQWSPAPQVELSGGVRHSRITFTSRDHYINADNGDDSGRMTFSATTPTLAALWKASDAWHFYVSAGRSFETPTLAEVAYRTNDGTQTGWNDELRPSKARHAEVGVKARLNPRLQWAATAFHVTADDELAVARNSGGRATYQNVGRTTRRGLEASGTWTVAPRLTAYAAYTYTDARFRDSFSAIGTSGTAMSVAAGNSLPAVPKHLAYAELAWRPSGTGWSMALEVRHTARLWANDANTAHAPSATVWGARAGWRTVWGDTSGPWRWDIQGRLDNLGNKRYAGSVIVNEGNARFYEPAPGRTITLTSSLTRAF